jgi:GTP-binding protein
MLVDQAIIEVRGGKGGDGAVTFRREKYIPRGGPDGGNGGRGGSVFLQATPGVDTLLDMTGRHHWAAEDGVDGSAKKCFGRNGEDLTIKVPPGTVVYDHESGQLIVDMDEPGKSFLIAKGGEGGFGNDHFKTSINQTPKYATPGEPGQRFLLRMELKLIADIGLVGKPNAGKSTLLSRLSAARPKIADYPFTTLEPQLGIAKLTDERRLVIADIPGLIEGAHHGAGLGHEFLRHIERTRLLVHMLDVDPIDNTSPIDNYRVICRELSEYSPELASKPQIIALNKMDQFTPEDQLVAVDMIQNELGRKVMPISAATGAGCRELLEHCWRLLRSPVN